MGEGAGVDVEVDVFSCVGLHDLSLSRRQASDDLQGSKPKASKTRTVATIH